MSVTNNQDKKRTSWLRFLGGWLGLFLTIALLSSWFGQSVFNDDIQELHNAGQLNHEQIAHISITRFNGQTLTLSEFRGKPVLLDFWASWCPPCRASMPELENMQEKYGNKLKILAVNVLEDKEQGKNFMTEHGYTLDAVHSDELSSIFSVRVLPTKVLLDKEGKLVWAGAGHMPFLTHLWLEFNLTF